MLKGLFNKKQQPVSNFPQCPSLQSLLDSKVPIQFGKRDVKDGFWIKLSPIAEVVEH